jgi:hypothetical protein
MGEFSETSTMVEDLLIVLRHKRTLTKSKTAFLISASLSIDVFLESLSTRFVSIDKTLSAFNMKIIKKMIINSISTGKEYKNTDTIGRSYDLSRALKSTVSIYFQISQRHDVLSKAFNEDRNVVGYIGNTELFEMNAQDAEEHLIENYEIHPLLSLNIRTS